MSPETPSPECALKMHQLCTGPKVIRRKGAPAWEAPIATLRCGCGCHRRVGKKTGATS